MRLSRPVWLTPSMAVLIGANVMVFYGIFELKWDVFALVFLFWLENAIIGIFNILKMLFNRPDSVLNWVIKFFYIPFFTFHYGMFTLVHGIFVVVLFGPDAMKKGDGSPWEFVMQVPQIIHEEQLSFMLFFLIFSHGFSLVYEYLLNDEFRRVTLKNLMGAPYRRVVVLHIAIIGSGFLLTLYGEPLYGLLLLAVLKILFDGWSHYWEHRRMQKYKEGRMTA